MTTNRKQCPACAAEGLTEDTMVRSDLGGTGSGGGSELPGGAGGGRPWWMPVAGGGEDDCPEPRESGDMVLSAA